MTEDFRRYTRGFPRFQLSVGTYHPRFINRCLPCCRRRATSLEEDFNKRPFGYEPNRINDSSACQRLDAAGSFNYWLDQRVKSQCLMEEYSPESNRGTEARSSCAVRMCTCPRTHIL